MISKLSFCRGALLLVLSLVLFLFIQGCDSLTGDSYKVFVEIEGEGLVEISPETSTYPPGTEVILKAVTPPDGEWDFSHWSGDVSSKEEEITIIIEKDILVVAHFNIINGASLEGSISIQHSWANSPNFSGKQNTASSSEKISVSEGEYKRNELIVQMMPFSAAEEKVNVAKALGGAIKGEIKELQRLLISVPGDALEVMGKAEKLPGVMSVQPNYIYQTQDKIPNDPFFSYQWHYPLVRLPQAWEKTSGSGSINIAVLDTGVDGNHPDLVNIVQGYNFIDDNEDPMDFHGHGTHVTGTIRAATDNERGVSGVMWQGNIVPVKVLGDNGYGTTYSVARGILYAADLLETLKNHNPAQVINMSLGGDPPNDDTLEKAVKKARENGTILVASAGNSNKSQLGYPAALEDVISVGAVAYSSSGPPPRASYSNYGEDLDIVAPGGGNGSGVLSTCFTRNGDNKTYEYGYMIGTSMAAPHVSGVIGLMLALGNSEGEIRETLHKTAMDLGEEGFDPEFGHGLVNANWAVNRVESVKIIVGKKQGNTFNYIAETIVSLEDKYFAIPEIVPGEYRVFAWIDIGNNGTLEPGDYFAQSELIHFGPGLEVSVDLILQEF